QNLVLIAMVFVIFWVTFFPLISEALTGTKISVGPPAFRPFIVPLAVALVALLAVGGVSQHPFALAMFGLAAFAATAVVQEFWRGVSARRAMTRDSYPVAFVQLVRRNRRRYGGYTAHFGLAVLLVGVAASSSFQHSRDVIISPGQSVGVDGYQIKY